MLRDKYVLIKRKDYDQIYNHIANERVLEARADMLDLPVDKQFFAIVEGDVFAPSGLDAYAANLRTVIEVGGLPSATRTYLEDLADDLTEMAMRWRKEKGKFPD